ncbi:LacI family DNA-binding transcriptional regulator, partial [Streptomyces sp. Tu 4128]|uniref:LacI family DNA-binding transcriptional regulator n=1 Tax=Streptomyces sp. Tu 4128 TaxID=1120314 RepID=UPI0013CE71C3
MSRQAPTLEDVAREAGVSRATVSRVVNGVRNVDPAIQDLVRRAIERTGYAPNQAARQLVTRRTTTVALVVSGAGDASDTEQNAFATRVFADPFFGRVVGGVVGHLRPRSMHPVLMFAETPEARQEVVAYLRQGGADGALVVSTHPDDPLPALLAGAGLPAVLFARPGRPVPLSYVDLAHRDGGRLAAEHLLERGCRRIATVTGPLAVAASQERLGGFR